MQVTKHQSCQKGTAQPPPRCLWHFGSLLEEAFGTSPWGSVWRGRGWTQPGVTTSAPGPRDPLSPPEMSSLAALPYDNDDNQITYAGASACRNKESRFFLVPAHCTINWKYTEAFHLFVSLCLVPHFEGKKACGPLVCPHFPSGKDSCPPNPMA